MEWIDDEISYYSECNSPYELYTKEMMKIEIILDGNKSW